MDLAFNNICDGKGAVARSGDRGNRNRRADEQAGEDDSADKGKGDALELGDGHDTHSLDISWPDRPALMPDDIAGGVPVSIFGGNPWIFLSCRFFRHAKKSDDWENLPSIGESCRWVMKRPLLFVYGTLRPGFDGPMVHWLADRAEWIGAGWIGGKLYQVADYPGFVPGEAGRVYGDLFALPEAEALLARLDAYEECTPDDPLPNEYRREHCIVETADGPVTAWVYLYALSVTGHRVIASGDYLAAR